MFNKLLCTDNCDLITFVNKKIKGKLKDCKEKNLKISEIFKKYQKENSDCSIEKILDECIGKIEW